MDEKNKYEEHIEAIKKLVANISSLIEEQAELKDMNFGLFYQHGRLGFVDLDAFADSTKMKVNEDGEEQTLTEYKNNIDKK